MLKICSKCKINKSSDCYGKLTNSNDGLRFDCKDCRKEYRLNNVAHIKDKNKKQYEENKITLVQRNKIYREQHSDEINQQRKEYRNREEVKAHIKQKQKDYLPIRKQSIKEQRKTDINFKMSEILRSKIHKLLHNRKTSYIKYIGCDLEWLKQWLEFRFDDNMNWDNFGDYWQIDHILPINGFNLTDEKDINICFHWTNLQPLTAYENRQKSDKLLLHYYLNNIVNINRFNTKHTQFTGYEILNESLKWLRMDLRYRKNAAYEASKIAEVDNPQPSL